MLKVVGAGVGRTGTHSLKIALEHLLGGTCHHMVEVFAHPEEIPIWTAAIDGEQIDWNALMQPYTAQVDWPGGSFWPELSAATPTPSSSCPCGTQTLGSRAVRTRSSLGSGRWSRR